MRRKIINILLIQGDARAGGEHYVVDQVTDSTEPTVGSTISKAEAQKFCVSPRYKVTIKRAKG